MRYALRLRPLLLLPVAFFAAAAAGVAQEAPPAPAASPAPPQSGTLLDQEYDGKTHWSLAPYVWAPTINGNFQYNTPTLPHGGAVGGSLAQVNVQVGPNSYLSHLNSAGMGSFEVRKGNVDLFGDFIYVNASTGGTYVSSISGPFQKLQVPVNLATTAHLVTAVGELAAGLTIARGHNADLQMFGGWRQVPTSTTLDYDIDVGKNNIIAKSGSLKSSTTLSDVIFGLRGKVFYGDSHWFSPYYADAGVGDTQNTWQAFAGVGYSFRPGALVLAWRSLDYNSIGANTFVQKLRLDGPLIGYNFYL